MLREYDTSELEPASMQVQPEFTNMVQNMTHQSERMETMSFNQNVTLQHMEAMFCVSIRASPFESHSGLLRSEYH